MGADLALIYSGILYGFAHLSVITKALELLKT